MGHFSITANPTLIHNATTCFGHISTEIGDDGTRLGGLQNHTSWTGQAATAAFAEMGRVSGAMATATTKFDNLRAACLVFYTALDTLKNTQIPDLNTRWTALDTAYNAAVTQAAHKRDGFPPYEVPTDKAAAQKTYDSEVSSASTTRTTGQGKLQTEFDTDMATVHTAAKAFETVVSANLGVQFTADQWNAIKGGKAPTDLMSIAFAKQVLGDDGFETLDAELTAGKNAAQNFPKNLDPATLKAYLATLDTDDPAFRQAYLTNLDQDKLLQLQDVAHSPSLGKESSTAAGDIITAVGTMLARSSKADPKSLTPMPAGFYDALIKKYEGYKGPGGANLPPEMDADHHYGARGYLLLAELVQAGQGGSATWDPTILKRVTQDTYDFERNAKKSWPDFSWTSVYGNQVTWPTAAARNLGQSGSQADALSMLFDALDKDKDASLSFLSDGKGNVDYDKTHYLMDGRGASRGTPGVWGSVLGSTMDAATDHLGQGGPGTPSYTSAALAADFINYMGKSKAMSIDGIMMHTAMADVISRYALAFNHMPAGYEYSENNPTMPFSGAKGELPYRFDLPIFDKDSMNTVLTSMFGEDYFAHKDHPDQGYPLYGQISAASQNAFRAELLDDIARDPGNANLRTQLAKTMGQGNYYLNDQLRQGLIAMGAGEDQANADSRAALDWVLGFGADKAVAAAGKASGAGTIESMVLDYGVGQAKQAVIDHLMPETDYTEQATKAGTDMMKYSNSITGMEMMQWLDESGQFTGVDGSPSSWQKSFPESATFLGPDGKMPDVQQLYLKAHTKGASAADTKAWEDFQYYYTTKGDEWLRTIGVRDGFDLGYLMNR